MQKLLAAIATAATLTVSMPMANAGEACANLNAAPVPNNPHHIRNVVQRNMQANCKLEATLSSQLTAKNYAFTFKTGAQPLTQLSLKAPANVRLSSAIVITNAAGEKLEATTRINGQNAVITFAKPVAPDSTLVVAKQVKAPKDVQAFEATLMGKTAGSKSEISLGTIKVQSGIN